MVLGMGILSLACSKDDTDSMGEAEGTSEVIPKVDVDLPVDPGELGLIMDVRDIFRKGYIATEAKVSFADYPKFDQTVSVDPISNLAILKFPMEDLTQEEKDAFENGTPITIEVRDGNGDEVGGYTVNAQKLLATGDPIEISTELPVVLPPLEIKVEIPYLIQPEQQNGVLEATCSSCFQPKEFNENSLRQKFYFEPVDPLSDDNRYLIRCAYRFPDDPSDPGDNGTGDYFRIGQPHLAPYVSSQWVFLIRREDAEVFVLEQDDQGWVKFRKEGTTKYLAAESNDLKLYDQSLAKPFRFRLLSDNIDWNLEDLGTQIDEPIMPPTKLEFAYQATIRNCTSGLLTETVGTVKSKEQTITTSSVEKMSFFRSHTATIGFNVEAALGGEIYGAKVTIGVEASYSFTGSSTQETETANIDEYTTSTEVSRSRALEVPAHSAVEVYDAIRVVKGARVPYTKTYRVTATALSPEGTEIGPLNSDQIRSQMIANRNGSVISAIGPDYIELTLRGYINITEMFETESGADQIPANCD